MNIGVLFDLDGVVIDSERIYTQFWEEVEKIYPTHVENFALVIKGSTLPKILNTYFPEQEKQDKINEMLKAFELTMKYEPFDEALRFIRELRAAGIKCAIVTSSSRRKMDNFYRQNPGIQELFDAIITGDMVTHSKPHPEPYLLGAKAIGIDIRNCCVFEDSLSGITSGIASGATVVGLATTLPIEEIRDKATIAINDFTGFTVADMLQVMGR